MEKIKIVLNKPFSGIDSGWPVRYIGLMKELSRHFGLSIFAPGNTDLLAKHFPSANVCAGTSGIPFVVKFSRGRFLASFMLPRREEIFLPSYSFYPDFRELMRNDTNRFRVSVFFGLDAFAGYGDLDTSDRKICDVCDSTARHIKTGRKNNSGFLSRLQLFLDVEYVKRIKRKFIPTYVHLLAITQTDAYYIANALPKNAISIVSNGTYLRKNGIDPNYLKDKFHSDFIIFLGFLDYGPNVTSLLYSLEHLWPLVHAKYPWLRFRIIGRNPSAPLKEKAAAVEGVDFVGAVEDIYPYLTEAKLFLAPMFSGGGMKNKFLESLSVGTPVVTNADGAAGIDMVSGVHGVIAESQSGLVDAVEAVLDAPEERYAGLVRNCVALAKNYSWETAGNKLCDLIEKLTVQ